MSDIQIEWPWQYNFPPFFTYQPHADTRSKQVASWKSLILDYYKAHKISTFDVRESSELGLFNNKSIKRTLNIDLLNLVLKSLQATGNAVALDKYRWEIYWHTLEEWGTIIYAYITGSNNFNIVFTLFELTEGDLVSNEEFFQINESVILKVLRLLEMSGKCETIKIDGQHGVVFF